MHININLQDLPKYSHIYHNHIQTVAIVCGAIQFNFMTL